MTSQSSGSPRKVPAALSLSPGAVITQYVRDNAQTQVLNITQQLDNGIRFLDFRIMMEGDKKDWYGLHMLETNQAAFSYLQQVVTQSRLILSQVRAWMDQHPQEIVVMWLSKHGSECAKGNDQYPGDFI